MTTRQRMPSTPDIMDRTANSPSFRKSVGSSAVSGSSFLAALQNPDFANDLKDAMPRRPYDAPGSPSATAKTKFQKLVKRYYYQLTIGCGDPTCPHRLCASCRNGARLNSDAAAILAVQLASRPRRFFCPRCPTEPDITLDASILASPSPSTTNSPAASPKPGRRVFSTDGASGMTTMPGMIHNHSNSSSSGSSVGGIGSASATRPFLYSLLSSSPFQSLFAPEPATLRKSSAAAHSLSSLPKTSQDLFGDFDDENNSAMSPISPMSPMSPITRQRRISEVSQISEESAITSGFMSGIRALTKYATGTTESSGKSKSLMDLPSLFSATVGFITSSNGLEQAAPIIDSISPPESGACTPVSRAGMYRSISGKSPLRSFTSMESLYIDDDDQILELDRPVPERQVSLGYLTLPLLRQAIAACVSTERQEDVEIDYQLVLNTVRTVFSSSTALSKSFLVETTSTNPHPSGLDILSIRVAYKEILELAPSESFAMVLVNATELLLAKIELNSKRLSSSIPSTLRQLIIVLENPLISDQNYHETLLKKLCIIFGRLRSGVRSVLTQWLSKYDAEGLIALAAVFHKYIECHFVSASRPDEALVGCIKCLDLLSQANSTSCLVPMSTFYSDTLARKLNYKEEYKLWEKGWFRKSGVTHNFHSRQHFQYHGQQSTWSNNHSTTPVSTTRGPIGVSPFAVTSTKLPFAPTASEFCYFDHSILFDPASKTRILHIDAMVQMSAEFEDAFVNQALVLHTQRFLQDSSTDASREQGLKQATNPYLVLEVRREKLVQDALDQIRKNEAHLKRPFRIKFVNGGEEGMDQGGVQKEFFQVLCSQLLDPAYGMFTQDEETRLVWINGSSLESEAQFELVGTVIGLALYNGVILGVSFPTFLYKKLLDESVGLEDIKQAFPALGRGLQQLLDWSDGDVGDVFLRTFEISYDVYGQVRNIPLVDGGVDILVTNENRQKYVDLYIRHLIGESVKRQFGAFKRGFLKVCGGDALRMCRAEELELLVCGSETTELDFTDLENAAEYDDGYHPKHPTIEAFWSIVHSFSLLQKRLLLTFVTASDRVPVKGLGHVKFVIQRNGPDTERLPTALTCFGRLLLPEYSDREKMKERLVTAIENARGFGLV
ncbi:hypothetical protein SmJEL517_g02894 [Synchytrium microbalum]|uniref:HECT-type E3 ubiquitin transferase n=1 Tax=Synchytrium microbalum TaxID=1806994 RepID=A0A507C987_9FUNG|nr:uncharacterized protein SmJEL517_g02894 [Synchytrium microbalum]TPX34534.1 hypothetical protein SmJEL517_g02894 [Synchytrium microbalum]